MIHTFAALLSLFALTQTPAPEQKPPASPPIPADTEIVTTASGLKYSVLKAGDGVTRPKVGDLVTMHYTGWLTDGYSFDSSVTRNEPFQFTLGGSVIAGWNEGVALMTKGQRLKLTISPELAWGAKGRDKIPPNATVIFEVELLDLLSMPAFKPGNKEAQKTSESGFTWEVVTPSTGASPTATDVVSLKFAWWNAQGELLQCSEREGRGQLLTSKLGDLPIPLFIEGAKLAHVGERIRIEAPAKVAMGAQLPPGLAPDEITVWELELVSIKQPLPLPPFALTPADKLLKTASGLGYEVVKEGTGTPAVAGKDLAVHYAGWLANGTPFDASYDRAEPMTFRIGMWLKGCNEGMTLMREGSIYRFTLPPELAYGNRGMPPKIPADATVVFYVELLTVAE